MNFNLFIILISCLCSTEIILAFFIFFVFLGYRWKNCEKKWLLSLNINKAYWDITVFCTNIINLSNKIPHHLYTHCNPLLIPVQTTDHFKKILSRTCPHFHSAFSDISHRMECPNDTCIIRTLRENIFQRVYFIVWRSVNWIFILISILKQVLVSG